MIRSKGVKKSATEVTIGMSILLGSFPRLNKKIAPRNRKTNKIKNIVIISIEISNITKKGLNSSTSVAIPNP